ncbi:MAG: hypothetical protein EOL88_04270 [Bacteroidia bacterium]|nr:hypothetical protein [Bacteroidales bacterium]NCD41288.1 hypothetical protein [Bacteroidia bacterium]
MNRIIKFVLSLFFLLMISFPGFSQLFYNSDFELVTIVKQEPQSIHVSMVAPDEFHNRSFTWRLGNETGNAVFSSDGSNATVSFPLLTSFSAIKGQALILSLVSPESLVIPGIMEESMTRVLAEGAIFCHSASLSARAVWSCKTTVIADSAIVSLFHRLQRHYAGSGEIVLLPVGFRQPDDEAAFIPREYFSGEASLRALSRPATQNGCFRDGSVYFDFSRRGVFTQFPQLLQKSAISYLITQSLREGYYRWFAPDLSCVFAWSPGSYRFLSVGMNDPEKAIMEISSRMVTQADSRGVDEKIHTFFLPSPEGSPDLANAMMEQWKTFRYRYSDSTGLQLLRLPKMKVSTPEAAMARVSQGIENPESLLGSTFPFRGKRNANDLEAILQARRTVNYLLGAEKLATIAALLKGGFSHYPEKELLAAWDKCTALSTIPGRGNDRIVAACSAADSVMQKGAQDIALLVKTETFGKPVIVVNTSAHSVTGCVAVPFPAAGSTRGQVQGLRVPEKDDPWKVMDARGNESPAQVVVTGKESFLEFNAAQVPGIGIKTYYMKAGDVPDSLIPAVTLQKKDNQWYLDNEYYALKMYSGGITSLYDKRFGTMLLAADDHQGGAFFIVEDNHSGQVLFTSQNAEGEWSIETNGPVRTSMCKNFSTPAGNVQLTLSLFHQEKKITWGVAFPGGYDFTDCTLQVVFHPRMNHPTLQYQVPFGIATFGSAELEYADEKNTVSDEIVTSGWVLTHNGSASLLFSGDLTHVLIGDQGNENKQCALHFVLPLSGKKTPDNAMRCSISLTSSYAGDRNLIAQGFAQNSPVLAVSAPVENLGMLPGEVSFFTLRNKQLEISCLKKSANSEDVVMRIFDPEGTENHAILEPMFSFSGFSTAAMNEDALVPVESHAAVRLKLKTKIAPYSINTIIFHRK